jgi:hypothetical protein
VPDPFAPKKCLQCGTTFAPTTRQRQRPGRWKHARFCTTACANRARAAGRVTSVKRKNCESCGNEFDPKRPDRRFCSRVCSSRSANGNGSAGPWEPPQPRICAGCGETYERREKEKPSDYQKRKFCSRSCSSRFANTCRNYGAEKQARAAVVKKEPSKPAIVIPPPPDRSQEPVEIWRPASWGGPYLWTPPSQGQATDDKGLLVK